MNTTEVAAVLAMVATYDRRTVTADEVKAWHGAIGDLTFEECRRAVVKHHGESVDWCRPGHLRRLVSAARQDAAMRELPAASGLEVKKPEWFDAAVEQHRIRRRQAIADAAAAGLPYPGASAIVLPIDRHRSTRDVPADTRYERGEW